MDGREGEGQTGLIRGCGLASGEVVQPALDHGATDSETGVTLGCRLKWGVELHRDELHPQHWLVAS